MAPGGTGPTARLRIGAWALVLLAYSTSPAQTGVIEQWAEAALAGSTFGGNVGSLSSFAMAVGSPDTRTCELAGQHAWVPSTQDSGPEWVELNYAIPVYATAVEVHQSLNPGAVSAIYVRDIDGVLRVVWTGVDSTRSCPAVLRAEFPALPVRARIVRVEMATDRVPGFNAIDAVRLVGVPAGGRDTSTFYALLPDAASGELPPSYGSSCADYDNDGWPDQLGPDYGGGFHIAHNEGDGTHRVRSALLAPWKVWSNGGVMLADYDNDGDQDFYLTGGSILQGWPQPDYLLRNDDGHLVDVTHAAGLADTLLTATAMWFDYDRDGCLDLYLTRGDYRGLTTQPNQLLRNRGDGTFVDVTAAVGLAVDFSPGAPVAGTYSGTVSADVNDDGWPDLYVPVEFAPSHLFLSDGTGGLVDTWGADYGYPNRAFGVAVGDVNGDGTLDLYQAAQWGDYLGERWASLMLLNLGGGRFTDALLGSGLQAASNSFCPLLADIDNDGDLDLLFQAGLPNVFANGGDGAFTDASQWAGLPGSMLLADVSGDGFLDVWNENQLLVSRGNANHFLRLDLVGTRSNRDGVGARVIARSGARVQTRELTSSNGYAQDDMMLHLGLGQATQVDELEIRWPSGQVDVLTDVPADQETRVIEGRGLWYPAPRTVWTVPPPKSVQFGQPVSIAAVCRPALFEPTATITRITGDLGSLGGPEAVPLIDLGDGTYRLSADFTVGGTSDLRDVEVFVEQQTSLGRHWINLSRNVEVVGQPGTAVAETVGDGVPPVLALAQNWPNPFNSSTVIGYSLPVTGEVNLAIYDLAGQRVAHVASGHRAAGSYRIHWDGTDDDGDPLASGVYLVRLTSGGNVQTRRLTLLR